MTTHNSMTLVQEQEQLINTKRRRIFVLNTQNHSLMSTVFFLLKIYKYHSYMETLKIMKLKCPVSICNLLVPSLRDSNLSLRIPKVRLDLSKNNLFFMPACYGMI